MPVTLSRRIRRIGRLPSLEKKNGRAVPIFDPNITPEQREQVAVALRKEAKLRRLARKKSAGPEKK